MKFADGKKEVILSLAYVLAEAGYNENALILSDLVDSNLSETEVNLVCFKVLNAFNHEFFT